jgi:hypothetical protein
MSTLDIYDPAQCCATGACSPDADDELARFADSLEWLKAQGITVSRYNLGHQPGAFAQNGTVKAALTNDGVGCLPLVLVDGRIVSRGRYPAREELAGELRVGATAAPKAEASACCAPAAQSSKPCCG